MSEDRPPRSVAFLHPVLSFGGGERVLVEQVRAVAAWDVPVDVWIADTAGFDHLAASVLEANPRVRDLRQVRSTNAILARLIARKPDVLLVSQVRRGYRAVLRQRRLRVAGRPAVVDTLHERYPAHLVDREGTRVPTVDLWLLTYDIREQVRAAFGASDDRMAIARPLFPSSLVDVDDGVREEARALRKAWGAGEGAVVIGYLGRLASHKGLVPLVEMARRLATEGRDVHVVLAGRPCADAEDFDLRLRVVAASCDASHPRCRGRFHVLETVRSARPVYAAFDVVALCSQNEGLLPLTLVEGISAGVCAVTTDVGGIAECLRDGVDAAVVHKTPDDGKESTPEVLAAFEARLRGLVDDPAERARLAAAGRARVRDLVAKNDFHEDVRRALCKALARVRT